MRGRGWQHGKAVLRFAREPVCLPGCRTEQSITRGDLGLQGCPLPRCLVESCS